MLWCITNKPKNKVQKQTEKAETASYRGKLEENNMALENMVELIIHEKASELGIDLIVNAAVS